MTSSTDAVCLQGCYREIELLDFSVNALRTLSVIDICNSSVTRLELIPYTHPGCPCGIPNILDSSAPMKARENFHRDPRRLSGCLRMLIDIPVNPTDQSEWSWKKVMEMKFSCGYAQTCPRTIGTRFTDDKDASRAISVYGQICGFPRSSGSYGKTFSHGRKPI